MSMVQAPPLRPDADSSRPANRQPINQSECAALVLVPSCPRNPRAVKRFFEYRVCVRDAREMNARRKAQDQKRAAQNRFPVVFHFIHLVSTVTAAPEYECRRR